MFVEYQAKGDLELSRGKPIWGLINIPRLQMTMGNVSHLVGIVIVSVVLLNHPL